MNLYGFDEAEQHLQSIKAHAKANDYIVRLGLQPVNGVNGKPKFEENTSVESLYKETTKLKSYLADNYTQEELESQAKPEFVDSVTRSLLDKYGQSIWGVPRPEARLEQAVPSDLYPEQLDINNKDHRSRIRVYLYCWIVIRAIKKLKDHYVPKSRTGEAKKPAESTKMANKNWNSFRRVERAGGPPTFADESPPESPDTPVEAADWPPRTQQSVDSVLGRPNFPLMPYRAPTASMHGGSPTKMSAPENPVPPILPTRETAVPLDSGISQDTSVASVFDEYEPPPLVDDTQKDPDYDPDAPPASSSKRRQTATSFERQSKLRKIIKKVERRKASAVDHGDIYAGPDTPSGEETADDDPIQKVNFNRFLEEDDDVTEEESPIRTTPTIPSLFRKQTESPRANRERPNDGLSTLIGPIRPGSSDPVETTARDLSRAYNPTTELRSLLITYLDPTSEKKLDQDRLLGLLKECWQLQEEDLKLKFAESYPICKKSFDTWVKMLKLLSDFQSRTGYYGNAGDAWIAHCFSLTSGADRFRALSAQSELQAWMNELRKESPPISILDYLRSHLALALHMLARMPDWLPTEDLADRIYEYNKALLPWFLDE